MNSLGLVTSITYIYKEYSYSNQRLPKLDHCFKVNCGIAYTVADVARQFPECTYLNFITQAQQGHYSQDGNGKFPQHFLRRYSIS